MRELNIELIEKLAKDFKFDKEDSYLKSYPFLIKHLDKTEIIDENDFVAFCHMVYGWMPRIIRLKLDNKEEILELVNKAKEGYLLDEESLNNLSHCINRSIVGTSKFLHFLNPDIYPIIDSKIFEYLTGNKLTKHSLKSQNYLDYKEEIDNIISNIKFKEIHRDIEKELGYSITPIRATELIIFQASKSNEK